MDNRSNPSDLTGFSMGPADRRPGAPELLSPGPERRRWLPRPVSILLKASASGVLLYLVVSRINVSVAVQRIEAARHPSLLVALLVSMLIPVVQALRWWTLARPLIQFRDAFTFTWIGLFYGLILPGGISGDVAKGSIFALRDSRVRQASFPASILTDRIVGFAVMLFCFTVSCLLISITETSHALVRFALPSAGVGAFALCALLAGWTPPFQRLACAAIAFIPWPRGKAGFQRFAEATFAYSKQPGRLWAAAALSVLGQFLSVALYVALLNALSIHFGPIAAFALYSIFSVLTMAPISIAGIGVRDWFAIGFFSTYGLPAEGAVAFAWLVLAIAVLQASIGGLWQLALILGRPGAPATAIPG
jgi:hypothetical protein